MTINQIYEQNIDLSRGFEHELGIIYDLVEKEIINSKTKFTIIVNKLIKEYSKLVNEAEKEKRELEYIARLELNRIK